MMRTSGARLAVAQTTASGSGPRRGVTGNFPGECWGANRYRDELHPPLTHGGGKGTFGGKAPPTRCKGQPPVSDLGRDNLPTLVDIAWQILFRLGFPVARIWWRLQRRRHVGALVAIHVGQSLLLLRSSYRSAWNFPGGSVRQGETPEVSVRRELAEEIGLVANAPLQLVGEVCGVWDGRIDRVFLFVLRLDRLPTLQLDNREIIGAQLVPIDDFHKEPLTGPVQAYVRGQFSPIDGGAAQSFSRSASPSRPRIRGDRRHAAARQHGIRATAKREGRSSIKPSCSISRDDGFSKTTMGMTHE